MSDEKISKNRSISCGMCLSILKTRLTKFEGNLERILGTIDKAIGKCNSNTEEVEKVEKKCAKCLEVVQEEDAERIKTWLEVTQEEEGEMIEDLLGAAFVCCQTEITRVVTQVMRFYKNINTEQRKTFIMSICSSHIGTDKKFTQIEVLEACANYFKHKDEWPIGWDEKNKNVPVSALNRWLKPTAMIPNSHIPMMSAVDAPQGLNFINRRWSEAKPTDRVQIGAESRRDDTMYQRLAISCQPSVNSQLFMDFVSSLRHSVEGGDDTIRANPPNPYNPCFYYGLKQEHGFDGLFGFSLMGYGNSKKTDF